MPLPHTPPATGEGINAKSSMNRFFDNGAYESQFLNEVAVRCPKCDKRALIVSDSPGWRAKQVRCSCSSCGYSATTSMGGLGGPANGVAKRRCRHCGLWLERTYRGMPQDRHARLHCPACKETMVEPIVWSRTFRRSPSDPYFGHPLWFVGDVKGNVVYAYNPAHLLFIKNYVDAKIRIRERNKNTSLASRLPSFLLDAKNRA